MENNADQVVAAILRSDDRFLIEVGRLTLLFSRIEDSLVHDTLELVKCCSEKMQEAAVSPTIVQLRILEKRDLLKRVVADVCCFYDVDHTALGKILDELSNINRLRRAIVHGWIRWSVADERPILVDSHGRSVPAWPADVANLNLKVLDWLQRYYAELRALMQDVLNAYDTLADKLLKHSKAFPEVQALFRKLKTDFAEL